MIKNPNVEKWLKVIIDSIFSGIMISIGSIIYLNCPNRIVGAFLFAIGLITILLFKFNLFTGKIGDVRKLKDIPFILTVFVMNAVGCLFIMAFPTKGATEIVANKLELPLYISFVKGIVCGILMFVAVKSKNNIIVIMAISTFILCGAEHSIADMCFLFASNTFSLKGLIFIIVVALGNSVGALTVSLWLEFRDKKTFEVENK